MRLREAGEVPPPLHRGVPLGLSVYGARPRRGRIRAAGQRPGAATSGPDGSNSSDVLGGRRGLGLGRPRGRDDRPCRLRRNRERDRRRDETRLCLARLRAGGRRREHGEKGDGKKRQVKAGHRCSSVLRVRADELQPSCPRGARARTRGWRARGRRDTADVVLDAHSGERRRSGVFLALSKSLDLAVAPLTWALLLLLGAALFHGARARRGRSGSRRSPCSSSSRSRPSPNRLQRLAEAGAARTYRPDVRLRRGVVLSGQVDADASRASGEPELDARGGSRACAGSSSWRERSSAPPRALRRPRPAAGRAVRGGAAARLARRAGACPPSAIVVEPGEPQHAGERDRPRRGSSPRTGSARSLLVTSAAHAPRALGCFRAVGLSPDLLPVDRRAAAGGSWLPRAARSRRARSALRELAGRVVYRVAGYTR